MEVVWIIWCNNYRAVVDLAESKGCAPRYGNEKPVWYKRIDLVALGVPGQPAVFAVAGNPEAVRRFLWEVRYRDLGTVAPILRAVLPVEWEVN